MTCPPPQAPGFDALSLLFDASADCVKLLDLDGRLLVLNAGGAAAMELDDPAVLVGQSWIDFWTDGERDAARAAVAAARAGGTGRCAGFLPTAKGAPRWWRSVLMPVRGPDGAVARLLVVSRDVSDAHDLAERLEAATRRNRALILATSEIVWESDARQEGCASTGLAEFSGLDQSCADRDTWLSLIHPDDRHRVDATSTAGTARGQEYVTEYRLRHHSGAYRWVEDRAVPAPTGLSGPPGWVGVISDIHDRVTASEALRDSEERLRLAVSAARLGIWDVDIVAGTRQWSPGLKAMLGLPPEAEESEALLFGLIHPDDRPAVAEVQRRAFRDVPSVTFRIRRADTGEERWIVSTGEAVLDAGGNPVRRLGTFQDVTGRKAIEQELWAAANQDPLTGLPNRGLFGHRLAGAVRAAVAAGSPVALILVDLDRFKEVNDTLGHDAGDAVLRETADRLRAVCGRAATIARLGGDEFAVLLAGAGHAVGPARTDPIHADPILADPIHKDPIHNDPILLAEAIVRELARPVRHGGATIPCSASLGLAVYPDHDPDADELLKNADLALYAAKRGGRGRQAEFDPGMKVVVRQRAAVLRRAREALDEGLVVPHYQPKVVPGGGSGGFEALLRWHENGTLRGPGDLGDAFEDPDLAARIGQRMLDLVLADIVAWRASGLAGVDVAINVAAAEFTRVDVAERWLAALARAGLPPSTLQIEVTESVFLGHGSGAVDEALARLHRAGVSIALDDFGTGFASLAHLRRYPVDWLKIDRAFVTDLVEDRSARAIVSSMIGLAHGIGIQVVAEGVETVGQARILAEDRCDLLQGYLIAKPMAASRVPEFLRRRAGLAPPVPVRA